MIGDGAGSVGGPGDVGRPYQLHYGQRTTFVSLIARPRYSEAKVAFVVVAYYGGEIFLYRIITLQWWEKKREWGVDRENGPVQDNIRD